MAIKMLYNRAGRTASVLSAIVVSGFVIWSCTTESKEVEPTLTILEPAEGANIKSSNVFLKVQTTHFSFAGAVAKTSAEVKGGHIHVFLDDRSGLDVNAWTTLSKDDTVTITSVSVGSHFILVEGAGSTHEDIEGMEDTVHFTVTAP